MGGTQSTRNITITNDSPIHVTEAVLNRMAEPESTNVNRTSLSAVPLPPSPPRGNYREEEEFWKKSIDNLKNTHNTIRLKMEQEFDKAVEETSHMFKKAQTSYVPPPCLDYEALAINCYKENPTKSLLCAKLVNDYSKCVADKRAEKIASGA